MRTSEILASFTKNPVPECTEIEENADGTLHLHGVVEDGEVPCIEVKPVTEQNRENIAQEGWAMNDDDTYCWGYNGYIE